MSEHAPHHHENHEQSLSHEKQERQPLRQESNQQTQSIEHKPDIEDLKNKVEKEAKSAVETTVDTETNKSQDDHYMVTKELKKDAYKRNLQRARKHMSTTTKSFSKIIHQPTVDAVSRMGEKTIARPTGILTGGIIALAGSTYLFWSAKHYGYQYNYLVLFVLFAGGYVLGLIIESFIYMIRRLRGAK